jgi:serine/threonine protein kinase
MNLNLNNQIIEQLFIKKKSINNFIYLDKGGTGVVYKYNDNAIKIIPKDKFNNSEYVLSEYFSNLVNQNITINFLKIYKLHEFDNYKVIEMEIADGNLYDWIKQKNSDDKWIQMILQIIITIRIAQQKINFYHKDLKPKNILFKKLNKNINFTYKLNNKEYSIETDTIFFITDFTHSESNITEKKANSEYLNIDTDLYELENLPKRLKVDKLMEKYNLQDILEIGEKSRLNDNFKSYYNDEIKKTEMNLKKYPQNIKDKFIKRSLIYYLLENKLIDIDLNEMSNKISVILSQLTTLDLNDKINQIYNENL